jgi:hypothetical protein
MLNMKYNYADKKTLLGAIGYELVQQRAPYLTEKDLASIVPQEISNYWQGILYEIVDSGMLQRHNGNLRFLHQSFQEYFAACHFLKHEATDKDAIRKKILQHRWLDTFVILLGFAGDKPEVINQIIEVALEVDPILTARFLRVTESINTNILQQFIEIQEKVLRNPQSGNFTNERAAQALAEHGRGPVRKALIRLALDLRAPLESRIVVLKRLSDMPAQNRFELIKNKIQDELKEVLEKIFTQKEDTRIYLACIDIVKALNLTKLGRYLFKFIEDETTEWSLRRSTWEACKKMELSLAPEDREIYTQACMKQVGQTEMELFQSSYELDRMKKLNEERCYLLKQIACPENLSLLLTRRFSLGIHEDVEKIIENVLESGEELFAAPNEVWEVLKVRISDDVIIDKWLELIREGDSLVATAVAHQLVKMGKQGRELPIQKLRELLDLKLTPDRLLIVAELISVCGDRNLAEFLEHFLHDLIKKTKSPKEFEALARLAIAFRELDPKRGKYLIAYMIMFFFHDNKGIPNGLYPLLLMNDQLFLSEEDFESLINLGGEYTRAAIFKMQTFGAATLLLAERSTITIELDQASRQKILSVAKKEDSLKWLFFFAVAACRVRAFEFLPLLISVIKTTPSDKDGEINYYYPSYGKFTESWLGMIIRASGYLARLLLDNNRVEEAKPAVDFLHELYRNLPENTDRRIVIGLSTALGFLGEWEPILKNLATGELWIRDAARNIFKSWVSLSERIEATSWIIQHLKTYPGIAAEVHSTLEELKKYVEDEIGIYITSRGDILHIVNEIKKMDEIRNLFKNKSISAFSEKVLELLKEPLEVSKNIYLELNEFLSELIPNYPKPFLKYDIHNFDESIEKIWAFAENNGLEEKFGTNIYRWYEYHHHYSKAREILQKLIDIAEKNNDRLNQAIYMNNFAYEYLLEQKWEEGAHFFKIAEELFEFEKEKDAIHFYNAKANYWTCKIENNDVDDIETAEREIKLILDKLTSGGSPWHLRKPYILLAKLNEQKGNIKEAILLVEEAISVTKDSATLYTEEDRKYLNKLKNLEREQVGG